MPVLKSFGVIVGLSCKLNIGHFFFTNVGLNSTLVVKLSVLFVFDGALKPALKPALTLLVFLLVCHANPTLNANNYFCVMMWDCTQHLVLLVTQK